MKLKKTKSMTKSKSVQERHAWIKQMSSLNNKSCTWIKQMLNVENDCQSWMKQMWRLKKSKMNDKCTDVKLE